MNELRAKIGLEVHVQLNTKTKLFCRCPTKADKPNSATCPTCLGLPGAKPVLNKKAVDFAIKLALALSSDIQPEMLFSRKTYFYPDMSKNYQITQYEKPLALCGFLVVGKKKIRLRRIHIEEDPASLKHPEGITHSDYVLVDYNRSGMPLCEIVTEPDLETPAEAREFLSALLNILSYLDVYDPHNFSLRADVNVSVQGGNPVEIKEITGAKEIEKAISFEIVRQESMLRMGQKVEKETRHYSADTGSTEALRTKETEEEYGYIFDADLPTFQISKKQVAEVQKAMPELPYQKLVRLQKQYKLQEPLAEQLVVDKEMSDCFEAVAKRVDGKLAASWFTRYLRKTLVYNKLCFKDTGITAEQMLEFICMIRKGELSDRGGEFLLRELVLKPQSPKKLAKELDLLRISDSNLESIVKKVLKVNKKVVEDCRSGKQKALQYLVGQVQKESNGKADYKTITELLKRNIY